MSTKKSSLIIFAFAVCAAFLLLPNYYNAQGISKDVANQIKEAEELRENILDYGQSEMDKTLQSMSPQAECEKYRNNKVEFLSDLMKDEYFIERDTENSCLIRSERWHRNTTDQAWSKAARDETFHFEHYFKFTNGAKEVCHKGWSATEKETEVKDSYCFPYVNLSDLYNENNEMGTIPSSGGWSEKAKLPEPIIIKKGEYYERDFSFELIQLLDPRDQSEPYTFSLNTMGGFPPMGLMLGSNGVLKGTPVGKDDHFEACVKNSSGRSVCKVINIKLEKDDSDKPELDIIESIKSAFENTKYTEINYKDLIYGEKGQIKSKIHDRISILMKDGSTVEMDQYSSLTPNSEYELTTEIGKFKFNYERFLGPNSFCAFGALLSESCRQVNTPNGTIRIKGTEFTVENSSSGTNIAVIEGTVLVSDAKNKKEIEINQGQFAFLKDGSLLEDPRSFESDQLDRWWEEDDKLSDEEIDRIMLVVLGIFALIMLSIAITKKITRKKAITEGEKRAEAIERKIRVTFSLIIGVGSLFLMLIFYLSPKFLPQLVLDAIIYLPFMSLAGLMLGILEAKLSEKILSASMIVLNIISVILGIVFIMPRY